MSRQAMFLSSVVRNLVYRLFLERTRYLATLDMTNSFLYNLSGWLYKLLIAILPRSIRVSKLRENVCSTFFFVG